MPNAHLPTGHRCGRQHYIDIGTGDPVVMIHGNPTWCYYYRNVVDALKSTHRCIVPDHVGCGYSDKPLLNEYDYSLKSRIDDLEALLDHLNVQSNITLIVHDWGGMIGMGYAVRHPGRIKRIIAINTGCTSLPPGKRLPWLLKVGRNSRLGAWLILKKNAFCRAAAKWCVTRRPLPPDVRAMYLKPYDTPANRIAVLKFVQTIPLAKGDAGWDIVKDVEANLHRFAQVPTLLLWGMKDFVFDKHFLAAWQKHFPHAETHTWPDCGHYLLEDAGGEAIMQIREFLAPVPADVAPN
jgi:cis-3-alkyl-4-acyloxetan-2-one decarboxylase